MREEVVSRGSDLKQSDPRFVTQQAVVAAALGYQLLYVTAQPTPTHPGRCAIAGKLAPDHQPIIAVAGRAARSDMPSEDEENWGSTPDQLKVCPVAQQILSANAAAVRRLVSALERLPVLEADELAQLLVDKHQVHRSSL